jgi:hypothetical protein
VLPLLAAVLVITGLLGAPPARAALDDGPRHEVVSTYSTSIGVDPADVYHPVDVADGQRLPVAFLMQGANVDKTLYSGFARGVASYGFVVVVSNHTNVVFGQVGYYQEEWSTNLAQTWMTLEDTRSGSPLQGRIDVDTMVLLGHSYGGAASLFAIGDDCQIPFCMTGVYQRPSNLRAAALFGSNTVTPEAQTLEPLISGVSPVDLDGVGTALVNGTLDGAATPANARATYDVMSDGPKALISVSGANHYGVTDVQNPVGAKPDPSVQLLPQSTTIETITRWSALWLLAQLGDPDAYALVHDGRADRADKRVTVELG